MDIWEEENPKSMVVLIVVQNSLLLIVIHHLEVDHQILLKKSIWQSFNVLILEKSENREKLNKFILGSSENCFLVVLWNFLLFWTFSYILAIFLLYFIFHASRS